MSREFATRMQASQKRHSMGKRLEMRVKFLTTWVMDTPVAGDRAGKCLELRFFHDCLLRTDA